MEYLASMYIDNEMDLNEKRQFVEMVRSDGSFYATTLDLLAQENQLRELPELPAENAKKPWQPPVGAVLIRMFRPLGLVTAGFATAALMFFTFFAAPPPMACGNRFVLFEPGARQVELAGSFTGWQRVAMRSAGANGYWELRIPVPAGEHRFAYILDGNRRMTDPTLPDSERDDFGGENSILKVGDRI